jgi:hypothetical protein
MVNFVLLLFFGIADLAEGRGRENRSIFALLDQIHSIGQRY